MFGDLPSVCSFLRSSLFPLRVHSFVFCCFVLSLFVWLTFFFLSLNVWLPLGTNQSAKRSERTMERTREAFLYVFVVRSFCLFRSYQ